MGRDRIVELSKRLSWLLRHGAGGAGLAMDAAGWCAVADVLVALGIDPASLDAAVRENDKSRLELRDGRIRAAQGHSREGMPVTLEALEASWERVRPEHSIWHGTHLGAVASIAREGILPGQRTHVHLAASGASRVGKRAAVDLLLEVSPRHLEDRGLELFCSPNGVLLARAVPPACIVGVAPLTRSAREAEASLRATLGLPAPGREDPSPGTVRVPAR